MFQYVDAGVLVVGPDGRVIDANPAAQRLFENGNPLNQSLDTLNASLVDTDWDDRQKPVRCELSHASGETRIYEAERAPIFDDYDQFNASVLLFNDVTELDAQKQELEQQRDELEETTAQLERKNERLDRFTGVVSHDLRNPLNMAQTYLDLSREQGQAEHFEKVADAHDRMETMIDELLTLARTETALDEADFESIPLEPLVEEAWNTASTGGATLKTDIPWNCSIEANENLLQNILENLFRNAADHNEPPLTVTVGTMDDDGFYVEDDGTGIPEENRTEVFEHGYTTAGTGSGFGLSIVQEFVTAHGWAIRVTESNDGGARFEITAVTIDA
ncbi:sensor histidine kinase [Halovenus salina]|uniref:histidine kinase n=1 Tax=Halovenus salina TaxID=1510225 RepID=A0ABD5VZL7_9EURY